MKVGDLFVLTETVEREHQDHLFTYPEGMVMRLDEVWEEEDRDWYWRRTEDGDVMSFRSKGFYNVHRFQSVVNGMCDVFTLDQVRPATNADLGSKLRPTYVPF